MSATPKEPKSGNAKDDVVRPIHDRIETARGTVINAAHDAVAKGRDTAAHARESVSGGFEGAPLAALAGGAAIGLLVGGLLPRSDREDAVLGPIGAKLIDIAREAAEAARDAGRAKLDDAGLSRNGARDAARGILDAALAAAFSAGNAAADTAKAKVAEHRD